MQMICGDCAKNKIGELVEIRRNRFNKNGLIDVKFGNARRPFFCFECGRKMRETTACALVYAQGQDYIRMMIPADDRPRYYTEDWKEINP